MAEEDTPQEEKTEEPTARRLEKAKEEGQVLRSQDMTIAAVTSLLSQHFMRVDFGWARDLGTYLLRH